MFCKFLRSRFFGSFWGGRFLGHFGVCCVGRIERDFSSTLRRADGMNCLDRHGVGGVKWERMREMHSRGET